MLQHNEPGKGVDAASRRIQKAARRRFYVDVWKPLACYAEA
jgi:hypothetical protein